MRCKCLPRISIPRPQRICATPVVAFKVSATNAGSGSGNETPPVALMNAVDFEESVWCLNGEMVFRVCQKDTDEETGTVTQTVTWYAGGPPDAGGTIIANPTNADTLTFGPCKEDCDTEFLGIITDFDDLP